MRRERKRRERLTFWKKNKNIFPCMFDENVSESKDKEYIIINIEHDLAYLKCKIIEKINPRV